MFTPCNLMSCATKVPRNGEKTLASAFDPEGFKRLDGKAVKLLTISLCDQPAPDTQTHRTCCHVNIRTYVDV